MKRFKDGLVLLALMLLCSYYVLFRRVGVWDSLGLGFGVSRLKVPEQVVLLVFGVPFMSIIHI